MYAAAVVLALIVADLPTRPVKEPLSAAELYNAYRWYGLPLPPKDAYLTRWEETRVLYTSDGKRSWLKPERFVRIGIVIRPSTAPRPAEVLYGTSTREERRPSHLRPVKPTPDCLIDLGSEWGLAEDWLVLAAQAQHLGWHQLAEAAFRGGRILPGGGQYEGDSKADPEHCLYMLRRLAWRQAFSGLAEPDTDRRRLHATLRTIAADDKRFRTEENSELFRALELTNRFGWSKPGSTEALIDGLTDCEIPEWRGHYRPSSPSTSYDRLVELGFDAVPALLRHLSDDRLTRSSKAEGINLAWYLRVVRMSEACRTLIDALSDGEVSPTRESILTLPDGRRLIRAHLLATDLYSAHAKLWLAEAQSIGEERWATEHVFREYKDCYWVNTHLLHLLRAKYPHRLPTLYRKALTNRPGTDTKSIALELAESRLDRETKLHVLGEAVGVPVYRHRYAALLALERISRTEFHNALLATLDWLASDVGLKECGLQNAADVASEIVPLIIRVDEPDCWDSLTRWLRKVSVRSKLDIMSVLADGFDPQNPTALSRSLRLMESMLDDATLRELKLDQNTPFGVHPGREYLRLAVRDFAAMKLAEYLDIDVPWDPARTRAEWADIREQVRVALTAERKRSK